MKKWTVAALCALFLAALVTVPSGCGSDKASKITPRERPDEQEQFIGDDELKGKPK